MKLISAALIALLLPAFLADAEEPSLEIRAEKFAQGKTYKLGATAKERQEGNYDCTTFVQEVLRQAGFKVDGEVGKQLNIVLSAEDKRNLKELVKNRDAKIKGVVTALVSSGQGKEITKFEDLKPGDIVQMWRSNGKGHCAIVKSTSSDGKTATLVGAHTDGVGLKEFILTEDEGSRWFAVRPRKVKVGANAKRNFQ